MIEYIQFIKWMLRKIFALPGRLIDHLAKRLAQGEALLTSGGFFMALILSGLIIGMILFILTNSVITTYGTIFILLAGSIIYLIAAFKTLHKAFRREQQQLIDTLKG